MRRTIFEFELSVTDGGEGSQATLRQLVNGLESIDGVESIKTKFIEPRVATIHLHVVFPNADAAWKLQRKVISEIVKAKGILARKTLTHLSEISDKGKQQNQSNEGRGQPGRSRGRRIK